MRLLVRLLAVCFLLASWAGCALITPRERRAPAVQAGLARTTARAGASLHRVAAAERTTFAKSPAGDDRSASLVDRGQPPLPDDGPTPEQSRRAELVVAGIVVLAALIVLFATL